MSSSRPRTIPQASGRPSSRRLVDSGGHTRHMATFWRRTWLPQADTSEFARLSDDFEAWTALRMREDARL